MKLKVDKGTMKALHQLSAAGVTGIKLPDPLLQCMMVEEMAIIYGWSNQWATRKPKSRRKCTVEITCAQAFILGLICKTVDKTAAAIIVREHIINPIRKSFLEPNTNPSAL